MSERGKPWRHSDRKHFRRLEKRQKKGKVVRAPIPEITSDAEDTCQSSAPE